MRALLSWLLLAALPAPEPTPDEAYLRWLEDVRGEDSLAFVQAHNQVSEGQLGALPGFAALERRLAVTEGSPDAIPWPTYANGKIRNFWTDATHPRGRWRETTLAEYRKATPAWTTLLDLDALSTKENAILRWRGAECLPPAYEKCLVATSSDGSDDKRKREFDTTTRDFVERGFEIDGGNESWKDENTLYIHQSEWARGTPLFRAKAVAGFADPQNSCSRSWDSAGKTHDVCSRCAVKDHCQSFLIENGVATKIDKPDDATFTIFGDDVLLELANGSLVTRKLSEASHAFTVLFQPDAHTSLRRFSTTKNHIIVTALHDVREEVTVYGRAKADAPWVGTPMKETVRVVDVTPFDAANDEVLVELQDFTVPRTLALQSLATGKRELMKTQPTFYDASNVDSTQHFATSKDGTKIPYFEVGPKNRAAPGPTILHAYGGFGTSQTPGYLSVTGAAWLEKGGTFVLANIRGGSEYGPEWHHAVMTRGRQKSFDDMAAVAEDLVARNVTTAKMLGVIGFSNGGLLASVMLTQRPELFGAIVVKAPLTDMRHYPQFFRAAGYESEYGNPDDPADWASMRTWAPLQNIRPGKPYPPAFFVASTSDDRAHPAHARKAVAMLGGYGYAPLYYEYADGGHEWADSNQNAHVDALVFAFFANRLGL